VPLSKLRIENERTRGVLVVRYNPEEYTLSEDNNFAVQGIPGLGSPIVQFVNGNQRTLEVELFFDTWDTEVPKKADVRLQTSAVVALMQVDGELHAPPILLVKLSSLLFRCVLSRVSEHITNLLPDGTPVRARLTCTFIEVTDSAQEVKETKPQTADLSKAYVVARGDTLSAIAGRLYDDPRRWRPIALANRIANPREIAVGQTLRVPALPFGDPETGEAVA
jgi:LysM repeat protein